MSKLLYELINSLTTSEKVYFKRNAKIHAGKDDKNYLKIYDALEKMDKYDKAILSDNFKGTPIGKYQSSEENYLKEKLLISLFNFNMNKTKRNQIQKGILMVEVMAGKGFRKEALKKLKSLKRSALKQEEFTWVFRLIELEEIILFTEGNIGYKAKLEELHQQRSKVTTTIQNLNTYHILRQEIRELQFSEHLLTNDTEAINDIYNNPLIANSEKCMSIKAKEHWYYIQVLISYLKRDFSTGLNISSDYVEFMNQHIHLFDINKILPALSNYIYHAALNQNKEHFILGEKILIEFSKNNGTPKSYIKYILYTRNLEFSYYSNDKKLMSEYLDLTIELIENNIGDFEESQIQYILMEIIRSTIVLNKLDLGMHYCNLWHQRGVLEHQRVQARLFSIMVHYELNYLDLIQSEIILLKKLRKNNKREKVLIQCFYTFMSSIIRHPDNKGVFIIDFQKQLLSISKNDNAYFSFISFDYYQWSLTLTRGAAI